MRFKNLKLAVKQGLGFSLILIIMAGVTIFSLIKMAAIKDEINQLNTSRLPSVIAVSEINLDISKYRINELQRALTYYGYKMREQEQQMAVLSERVKKNQERYEPLIASSEEQALYSEFQWKWEHYLELHEQYMKLSRESKDEEAVKLLNEEARKLFEDLGLDLDKLIKENKQGFFDVGTRAESVYHSTRHITVILLALTGLLSTLIVLILVRTITEPIKQLEKAAKRVAEGDMDVELDIQTKEEIGSLAASFNQMTESLRRANEEAQKRNWFQTGQNELNQKMRGDQDVQTLARHIIECLTKYLGAQIGALYLADEVGESLRLTGTYAFTQRKGIHNMIKLGEGLVGQSALEKEMISIIDIPENYIRIQSGLGEVPPRNIVVTPFLYEKNLIGVIELGSIKEFSQNILEFLKSSMENIAIGFHSSLAARKIKSLLQETQQQAEELQSQQEELRTTNEELASQTEALKASEARLIIQQEELQTVNEELENKAQSLEAQQKEILIKNRALEAARSEIEQKAKQLEITSKYKSEFLANMSHELRTPLNSMLILARNLSDNKEKNLSSDQTEAAKIIYKSGNDLLSLINEILDLSKIEAGKMDINIESIALDSIIENIKAYFKPMLDEKGVVLDIYLDKSLPKEIQSDQQRLEQILKNFMSNAVKFTEKGSIIFSIQGPASDLFPKDLNPQNSIAISVKDTGIGIPKNKQMEIFEAFQQVDGSTSRKYGGTGLGLSISRELAKRLGGEIHLSSEEGKGSTFTLFLPVAHQELGVNSENLEAKTLITRQSPKTDQETHYEPEDKRILIIEADSDVAKTLFKQCHKKGFKGIVAGTGEEGLELTEKYQLEAVLLDIKLPGMNGWAVLDALKNNPKTRHIPVHVVSDEELGLDVFRKGAMGFLCKPMQKEALESVFQKLEAFIEKNIKDLLIIEDDAGMRKGIKQLIGNGDVQITEAETGEDAIEALQHKQFDCMILDLGLPDISGFELLNLLEKEKDIPIPPVIIYTGRELSREEEEQLRRYADSIIVKGVKSEERLLDETSLFLHRIVSHIPPKNQKTMTCQHDQEHILTDKKILVVDDDMRNVFALSKILKDKGMMVLKAENGKKALTLLEKEPDIDLVLMDIMMPVMDGYEAIQHIRKHKSLKNLPVIALTAKVMRGDKEKCMAAGASDYLPKPVDVERLLSMMRVWLYK